MEGGGGGGGGGRRRRGQAAGRGGPGADGERVAQPQARGALNPGRGGPPGDPAVGRPGLEAHDDLPLPLREARLQHHGVQSVVVGPLVEEAFAPGPLRTPPPPRGVNA